MTETIKRLKEWANRAKPPNASMHRQAKSMEKALNRIKRLQRPVETKQVALAFDTEQRSGNDVLRAKTSSNTLITLQFLMVCLFIYDTGNEWQLLVQTVLVNQRL